MCPSPPPAGFAAAGIRTSMPSMSQVPQSSTQRTV